MISSFFYSLTCLYLFVNIEFRITKSYIKLACRSDGRLTGEAFIRFDSMAEAQDALKYDKNEIGKRYVELFVVDPSEADHVMSV